MGEACPSARLDGQRLHGQVEDVRRRHRPHGEERGEHVHEVEAGGRREVEEARFAEHHVGGGGDGKEEDDEARAGLVEQVAHRQVLGVCGRGEARAVRVGSFLARRERGVRRRRRRRLPR